MENESYLTIGSFAGLCFCLGYFAASGEMNVLILAALCAWVFWTRVSDKSDSD